MAFSFLSFFGDNDDTIQAAEILLGEPDASEAHDIALHVSRCSKRYKITILRINKIDRKLLLVTLFTVINTLILITNNDKWMTALSKLL